ncbi:MAG: histidine phosphatase family protein [Porticoccaceae bacterium]
MASIILIRHGQASFGAANYDQLSGLGRRQAQLLNDYFSDCGITLDAIYCGTLARQRQTAEIATKNQLAETPFHIDPRFNEIRNDEQFEFLLPELIQRNPSVAKLVEEAKSDSKSYQKVLEQVFQLWVSSVMSDDSGIQSWQDYSAQVEDAVKDLSRTRGQR